MKKNNRRKVVQKKVVRDERIWVRIPWYGRALMWWAMGSAVGLFLFHAIEAQAAYRCSQLADQAAEFDDFYITESEQKMCESVDKDIIVRFAPEVLKEMTDNMRDVYTSVVDEPSQEEPDWYKTQQFYRQRDMAYLELRDALKVVCSCESTGQPSGVPRHYENDDSDVLRGRITPADTGMCQINLDYHEEAARSMGLDVHDPHDNVAYANYLYDQYGLQPWSASRKCWEGHI